MAKVNEQVKNLLENGLDGVTVRYQYPDDFANLPVVTYYTLTRRGSFGYDNTVVSNTHTMVIDIWANYPKESEELNEKINTLMSGDGWYHEMEMDVPNPDPKVKHRTIRFTKIFELNKEE